MKHNILLIILFFFFSCDNNQESNKRNSSILEVNKSGGSGLNLQQTASVNNPVKLSWTAQPLIQYYAVYRKRFSTDSWTQIGTVGSSVTTFTDNEMEVASSGTLRYYKVKVVPGYTESIISVYGGWLVP